MRVRLRSENGVALITVLLVSSLILVAGTGLVLVLTINQLAARNHLEAAMLQAGASAGIELAAEALTADDWQAVLTGAIVAAGSDGAPDGTRMHDGTPIDLAAETNWLTCGRRAACSPGERSASTIDRPWGENNADWRLYLFGPLRAFAPLRHPPSAYLLVWIGDDSRETDGRPDIDGGEAPGRHVLRAFALAIGRDGARRAVQAELVRLCLPERAVCEPGIRVQSQRESRHAVP